MASVVDPPWLPPAGVERVVVSCTARTRGLGIRRLPDRQDAHGRLAGVLVETLEEAEEVLRALDRPGRTLVLDVERKQPADLMQVARDVVRSATVVPTKANDATVRALDVTLTSVLGPDLDGLRAVVVGTGNVGFKSALLLAERNAEVRLHGRDPERAALLVTAMEAVLPAHHAHPPRVLGPADRFRLLVSAVSADGVVDEGWLERAEPGGTVIDVGIGNLSAGFVAAAGEAGITVLRLDTRACEAQVLWPAAGFGPGGGPVRALISGVPVASGGLVAERGVVVVDDARAPTQLVGVADGRGGLVPPGALDAADHERMERVLRDLSPH